MFTIECATLRIHSSASPIGLLVVQQENMDFFHANNIFNVIF